MTILEYLSTMSMALSLIGIFILILVKIEHRMDKIDNTLNPPKNICNQSNLIRACKFWQSKYEITPSVENAEGFLKSLQKLLENREHLDLETRWYIEEYMRDHKLVHDKGLNNGTTLRTSENGSVTEI